MALGVRGVNVTRQAESSCCDPGTTHSYPGLPRDPRPCLVDTLQEVADHVVPYLQQMKTWYPDIEIGHVELYPEVGVEALKQWIVLLEANKVPLPYLHLDVHFPRVQQYISFGLAIDLAADLRERDVQAN